MTDDNALMCNPWETRTFLEYLDTIPDTTCDYCLPDCTTTLYEASVSSAQFKPCDHTNLEASPMCLLTSETQINPPIWASSILRQYENSSKDNLPDFITNTTHFLNKRDSTLPSKFPNLVFQQEFQERPTYNAFEEDIAVVNFYFDKSSILQFTRQESMTEIGFISQLGGLLGLFIGFSFISAIEIIYWLTIRLGKNLKKEGSEDNMDHSATKRDSWIPDSAIYVIQK